MNTYQEGSWVPPILRTVATSGEGRAEVITEAEKHWAWLQQTSGGHTRRISLIREALLKMTSERILEEILKQQGERLQTLAEACFHRTVSPGAAVEELVGSLK